MPWYDVKAQTVIEHRYTVQADSPEEAIVMVDKSNTPEVDFNHDVVSEEWTIEDCELSFDQEGE